MILRLGKGRWLFEKLMRRNILFPRLYISYFSNDFKSEYKNFSLLSSRCIIKTISLPAEREECFMGCLKWREYIFIHIHIKASQIHLGTRAAAIKLSEKLDEKGKSCVRVFIKQQRSILESFPLFIYIRIVYKSNGI